jgi:hypothetical protein
MPTLTKLGPPLNTNVPGGIGPDQMELPEPTVSLDVCAHALGAYMTEWDKLSLALTSATEVLLGTDDLRAHIIVESIQHSSLRDALRDVASHYLNASQFSEMCAVLEDIKKIAGIRNRLVHGRWTMIIKMHEGKAVSNDWARVSVITDKDTLHTMMNPKSQKSKALKERNQFSPDDIYEQARKIGPIADKLITLTGTLKVSRSHPEEPRSQRRRAARKPKGKRGR